MRKYMASVLAIVIVAAAWVSLRAADAPAPASPKIGTAAPLFALPDQDGKTVNLKDFNGKIVVLEWTNPSCPYVKARYKAKTMQTLAAKYAPDGVTWIAINSTKGTTNASDKQWAADQGIGYPILNDVATNAGKAYGATNTPEMYIVGKDGTLLYKGGLDNDDSVDASKTSGKVNYVAQALDEILAGKSVSQPETKAYGCGVHYAD